MLLRVYFNAVDSLGDNSVNVPSFQLLEEAVNIAWVYLKQTGELGDGNAAAEFLTDKIDLMIRRGQRNRMFLANMAIIKYRDFRYRDSTNIIRLREDA